MNYTKEPGYQYFEGVSKPTVQDGDEFSIDGGTTWHTPSMFCDKCDSTKCIHRRKLPIESPNSWIPISTLPKPEDYPVYVTDGKETAWAHKAYIDNGDNRTGRPWANDKSVSWDDSITHWCPMPKHTPPPLPQLCGQEIEESAIDCAAKSYGMELSTPRHSDFSLGWVAHKQWLEGKK